MKNGFNLVGLLVLAGIGWFTLTRPLTLPELFVMQLACSDPSHLNQRAKFDCWLMLQFGRVLNMPETSEETCPDPKAHVVGNHRCCGLGYHSNDGGASTVCYKD
jgi:hypothetical protein